MIDPAHQPGFHRRFIIDAQDRKVRAAVEDDWHCMAVTVFHDGSVITAVNAEMDRAPWTTCPGAIAVIRRSFAGVALADVAALRDKKLNCTHLYDLALLAVFHHADCGRGQYDLFVTDPVEGQAEAIIRKDGQLIHRLVHRDDTVIKPGEIAGQSLFSLRDWIGGLSGLEQQAARILQWGAIMAHGRTTPMDQQSGAQHMPPNCYSFQPENRVNARRVGKVIDFSADPSAPLDHLGAEGFLARQNNP